MEDRRAHVYVEESLEAMEMAAYRCGQAQAAAS
jgi:hypothetical protein